MNCQKTLLSEVRKKHKTLAKKEETSDRAAIQIFCLCCMGGSIEEVRNCTASQETCPFYIRRTGINEKKKKRKISPEEKERLKKQLKKARKKNVQE